MSEWLNSALDSGAVNVSSLFAILILGFISTFISCCNYAIIGSATGISAEHAINSSRRKQISFSLAFFIGCVVSLAALGALMGYVGSAVAGVVGSYWTIIVAVLLILFGSLSLGLVPIKIPQLKFKSTGKGFFPGFLLGMITGILAITGNLCCNPILPILLGASFVKASVLGGLTILVAYAVGYSVPFTIAIAGIQIGISKMTNKMKNTGKIISYVAGTIMIATGFYLIITY